MSDRVRWRRQGAPCWDASPPPPRVRKYDRLKVTAKDPLEVILLSGQLEETWTHHVDGRTVFCTGQKGGCWLNHEDVGRPRYGAWLAVQVPKVERTWLLRLTAVGVSVESRLRELRGQLRGRHMFVWRIHGHELSEMHCRLADRWTPLEGLCPCPDVRFQVEHMMEAADRPKGDAADKKRAVANALRAQLKEVPNER